MVIYDHSAEHIQSTFEKYAEEYDGLQQVNLDSMDKLLGELVSVGDKEKFLQAFDYQLHASDWVRFTDFISIFQYVNNGHSFKEIKQCLKIKKQIDRNLKKVPFLLQNGLKYQFQSQQEAGEENKQEIEKSDIDLKFQVGSNSDNTLLKLNIKKGVGAEQLIQQLKFANIDNDNLNVLIRLKVVDSQQAKQQLEDIFNVGLEMAKEMLPPGSLDTLKFEFYNPDQNSLYIQLYSDHLLFKDYLKRKVKHIRESLEGNVDIDLHFQTSFTLDLLKDDKNLLDSILKQDNQGIQLEFRAELAKQFLDSVLAHLDLINREVSTKKQRINYALMNMFFAQAKIDLRFNTIGELYDYISQTIGVDQVNNMFLAGPRMSFIYGLQQYTQSADQLPFGQDLLNFAKTQLFAEIDINFIQSPDVISVISLKTKGISELLDIPLNIM